MYMEEGIQSFFSKMVFLFYDKATSENYDQKSLERGE